MTDLIEKIKAVQSEKEKFHQNYTTGGRITDPRKIIEYKVLAQKNVALLEEARKRGLNFFSLAFAASGDDEIKAFSQTFVSGSVKKDAVVIGGKAFPGTLA